MADNNKWREIMGHAAYALDATKIEVLEARPGYAKTRMPVTPGIINGHGNVHGGAYFTFADFTAAIASNMHGVPTVATNATISFLRAVHKESGDLFAEARTVKTGKRMNFMTAEIRDAEGNLIAVFQASSLNVAKDK